MYIYMYTHNKRYRTTFPFFTSSFFSGHVFHFFPQICKKKRGYTIFLWVLEGFCLCPYIFLHFCWDVLQKKKAATFFDPWLMFSARIFRNVFFMFPHTCCKTTWLHHFSPVFYFFYSVLSLFPFLLRRVAKKKRGYTSVGSNVKNCRAFYVLGHPWLIPQK